MLNVGHGDYTAERDDLLQGISLDDIIASVREIDAQKRTDENNFGEGK